MLVLPHTVPNTLLSLLYGRFLIKSHTGGFVLKRFLQLNYANGDNMAYSPLGESSHNLGIVEIIHQYFKRGFTYKEILEVLRNVHDFDLSLRQLHRVLRAKGLFRKGHSSQFIEVIAFVEHLLEGSHSSLGYRQVHQRCVNHGLRVSRLNVCTILKLLDKEGVEARKRRKLKRRSYFSKGPNWVWHLDGYDKLKPYGLPIK